MTDSLSSLDDLFSEAKAHILVERAAAKTKIERRSIERPAAPLSTQALYLDEKNWTRSRGLALIHEETETVLGNFSEYLHNSVPGCRKLVREEAPISIAGTERVAGSWWLGADRRPEPKQVWHERRMAVLHLHLDKLGVHSPACEVVAHLSYGSIARVELAVDTQLMQGEILEQLLFLPAGTNVLEVMSLDCKMALRREIGL